MRRSEHHGWAIPEEGDSDYVNIFNRLINAIDRDALLIVDSLPSNHTQGRWIVRITDQTVFYDNGSNFLELNPKRTLPDEMGARFDQQETIGAKWTFEQSIDADIDGRSEHAGQADEANDAQDATTIQQYTPLELAEKDNNTTIWGYWTFQSKIYLEKANITSGTLEIPRNG